MSGETKKRVNISIDKELYSRMQFYNKKFGINWSAVIEQSLLPVVALYDKVMEEIRGKGAVDLIKVKMMFQRLFVESMGAAHSAYNAIDKDLDKIKVGGVPYKIDEKSLIGKAAKHNLQKKLKVGNKKKDA